MTNKDNLQLSVDDIYPRQAMHRWRLSPAGDRLVFVWQHDLRAAKVEKDGQQQVEQIASADLAYLPAQGGSPQRLTGSGEWDAHPDWSPDGQWIAVQHDGVGILPAGGGSYRRLATDTPHVPNEGSRPRWLPDASGILYGLRRDDTAVLRLATADGRTQRTLLEFEGYFDGFEPSPDGRSVAVICRPYYAWNGDVRLVDVGSGEARVLCAEAHSEYCLPAAAWTPDGQTLVVRSNRSGWAKFWLVPPADASAKPLTTGDWDDYDFCFAPDGKRLVFASRAEQPGTGDDLWIASLAGGPPQRLTRHPGVNRPIGWSRHGQIFYWHGSPTEPGDLWSVAAAGGEPRRLTCSEPLELERKLARTEEVWLDSASGGAFATQVFRPADYDASRKYPAIVWIRGGPTAFVRYQFREGYGFGASARWLANQGYIVLSPNYHGSTGHGVPFMEAVAGDGLGKADLGDVLTTGEYARTLPDVDLSRGVGVGGYSWGGYLTLMAITQAPNAFSCAVAGGAPANWDVQQGFTETRWYDYWLLGGWAYDLPALAAERSPINFVDRIRVPLLLGHGGRETNVPLPQTRDFIKRVERAGVDLEYKIYEGEGHGFRLRETRSDWLRRIREFYGQHLQPWNYLDNPVGGQIP